MELCIYWLFQQHPNIPGNGMVIDNVEAVSLKTSVETQWGNPNNLDAIVSISPIQID